MSNFVFFKQVKLLHLCIIKEINDLSVFPKPVPITNSNALASRTFLIKKICCC